jgi:hypothetical protein
MLISFSALSVSAAGDFEGLIDERLYVPYQVHPSAVVPCVPRLLDTSCIQLPRIIVAMLSCSHDP